MYPMKFQPLYKERIWGGTRLRSLFGKNLTGDQIGESWELSGHEQGLSIVANGSFAGKTINEVIALAGTALLGEKYQGKNEFPLLIKLLDAQDNLSIQVHPTDEFAAQFEEGTGKSEAWYVVHADPGAKIVYGLQAGVTKAMLSQAIVRQELPDLLREVPVAVGDMIYVPAGTIHALCSGVVVYEVQQTSDLTYRLYDYNRRDAQGKPRQMHIQKGLDAVVFPQPVDDHFCREKLSSPYFSLQKLRVHRSLPIEPQGSFIIYCVIAGTGHIDFSEGNLSIVAGDTVLIPAALGPAQIAGELELLKVTL